MTRRKRADSGSLASRTRRAHSAIKGASLSLAGRQREALLQCHRLRPVTRKKITQAGDEPVHFTHNELVDIIEKIGDALDLAPDNLHRPLSVVREQVVDALEQGAPDAFGAEHLQGHPKSAVRSDLQFQFRIAILDIEPEIWRRILVPDCTLADLHVCIQAAFGWEDCHLHEFQIGGLRFGPRPPDDFPDLGPSTEDDSHPRVSQLVPQSGKQSCWAYVYDFGDGWRHEIVYEGCAPADPRAKPPRCIEGARACPPEDCGGPWGYVELLDALDDPAHERHEELLEWIGPVEPEAFDAKRATSIMRKWLSSAREDE